MQNDLVCIVRAHEVQEEGFKRHFDPIAIERRMKEILGYNKRAKEKGREKEREEKERLLMQNEGIEARKWQESGPSSGPGSGSGLEFSNRDSEGSRTGSGIVIDGDPPLSNPKSEGDGLMSEVTYDTESSIENEPFNFQTDDFPPVITIFSAPNYCDRYQNKAAILRIDLALDEFRVIQYSCVEHPVPEVAESQMDNHFLAIVNTCPYMPTSLSNFVRLAVELGPEREWGFEKTYSVERNPIIEEEEEEGGEDENENENGNNEIINERGEARNKEGERDRIRNLDTEMKTDWGIQSQKDTGRTTSGNTPRGSPRNVRAGETERHVVYINKDIDDNDDVSGIEVYGNSIDVYGIEDKDRDGVRGSERESIETGSLSDNKNKRNYNYYNANSNDHRDDGIISSQQSNHHDYHFKNDSNTFDHNTPMDSLRVGTTFDFDNHNSAKKISLKSVVTKYLQDENRVGRRTAADISNAEGGQYEENDDDIQCNDYETDGNHATDITSYGQHLHTFQKDKDKVKGLGTFLSWVSPDKLNAVPIKKKKAESISISLVRSAVCNAEDTESSQNPYSSPRSQSPLTLFKVFWCIFL